MKSYSARRIFTPYALRVLERAERIVAAIPDADNPTKLRCHEVARVVFLLLQQTSPDLGFGDQARVIDGCYFGMPHRVEHGWIEFEDTDATSPHNSRMILDTFAVGRLPQVQLLRSCDYQNHYIHDNWPRTDIDGPGPLISATLRRFNLLWPEP